MNYYRTSDPDHREDGEEFGAIREQLFRLRGERGSSATQKRKRCHAELRALRLRIARQKASHLDSQWEELCAEFNWRCVRCGCVPEGSATADHIIPLFMGGSDGIENLQPLCRECNTTQGSSCFDWAAYRRDHGWAE